jgi:hypothetical protein
MKDIMAVSIYDFQNASPGRIDGKNSGAVVKTQTFLSCVQGP